MATPPGRPCFPHLHLKHRLPAVLYADVNYELTASCTNEMDMWDSGDTEGWGNTLPVIHLQVLHPHLHAVETPAVAAEETNAAAASSSVSPTGGVVAPRLCNAAARLTADCKPLLSRAGKATLKFSLSPSPVLLARTLSSWPPTAPLTHHFFLHISVPGPLGAKLLPAVSGPHQLFLAPKGAKSAVHEKLSYVMGEHGVHHAIFVPLESTRASGGKLPSVYSFPPTNGATAPPAFVRFKEILGVNLGGRIWDCGLLLFEYLRDSILHKSPEYFHGRKILEVGSGTGIVGIWLWAYVLLKNRQRLQAADRAGTRRPQIPQTTFLLTDQEEAMDNLRDNIQTNLDLLTGGESDLDHVRLESSQLSWGSAEDHRALAIQPTPEPFDLILASDVVFNPIYFTPLLESFKYISGPNTTILMAYRPRASDRRQDEVFFRALGKYGWTVRKDGKYQDVFMLILERIKPEVNETTEAAKDAAKDSSDVPSEPAAASSTSASSPTEETSTATAAAATPAEPVVVAVTEKAASGATLVTAAPAPDSASSSPSAAAAAADDEDDEDYDAVDPLDEVLNLHNLDLSSGAAEGAEAALRQVEADGLFAGRGRGAGIAGEFGFYFGFLHVCTLLREKHAAAYPDRIWNRCAKLHASLLASPLYQSAFDPSHMEDGSALIALRNGFKALMTQMGVWEHFQQQQAETQKISF